MNHHFSILIVLFTFLSGCKNSVAEQEEIDGNKDSIVIKNDSLPNPFDIMDELTSRFENKVKLDTFITFITKQKNIRHIGSLYESWNYETNLVTYRGYNYSFELKIDTNQTTTFIDGKHRIKFGNYSLTCIEDTLFECEDYGFNVRNSLKEPKIIEIAGQRFLYADVTYMCNGIGCGCNITFIYDLQTKKPAFIENYRVPYDGFFISDFDNDNNPDLLVISKHFREMVQKNGLRFDEFDVRLSWFYYDKGKFKPKKNIATGKSYFFELFSFVPDYNHSSHGELVYSITKNNWAR